MHRLALFALMAVPACAEFDPALYRAAELAERTADRCVEGAVPLMSSSTQSFALDLSVLHDDWQAGNCVEGVAVGNDGFFAVDMTAGQKFHFHVTAIDAIDPVVYVIDSCDERVCQPLNAASSCGGEKEHLSFLAPRTARYYVGVDSTEPGGGRVEILAISPVCGDGDKQHSEACDDGNLITGDGCDALCRLEVAASERLAPEPNDDLTAGNHLLLADGTERFVLHGVLEGPCDPETYSFDLSEPRALVARMLAPNGEPCRGLDPEQQITVELHEGLVRVATGAPSATNACPELFYSELRAADAPGQALPAASSTYHVRVSARGPQTAAPVEYALELLLAPPTSAQN